MALGSRLGTQRSSSSAHMSRRDDGTTTCSCERMIADFTTIVASDLMWARVQEWNEAKRSRRGPLEIWKRTRSGPSSK